MCLYLLFFFVTQVFASVCELVQVAAAPAHREILGGTMRMPNKGVGVEIYEKFLHRGIWIQGSGFFFFFLFEKCEVII